RRRGLSWQQRSSRPSSGHYRTWRIGHGSRFGPRARLLAMRVLAVEASTLSGGAALLDGERGVRGYTLDGRVTPSERPLAAIDQLLSDAGWTARELEGLAVSVGPGSFTGLRVGLSTVKGLALALAIPVAAVPTLDAMAAMLPYASLPVCPVLDARKS